MREWIANKRDSTLVTNFGKEKRRLYEVAVVQYGDPDLYILDTAYDLRGIDLSHLYDSLHVRRKKDLSKFWTTYRLLERLMGST